nr:CRN effector protein [Phytophthora cinnamomi]
MVKLFCAIVGVAGNAFPVVIDAGETVGDLKDEIKKKMPVTITGEADKVQLFLAKTADGTWLTEADVKIGVKDTTGLKPLDAARSEIGDVGLSEDAVRLEINKDEVAALKGPVNVLVKVPGKGKRSRRDGWLPESFLPVPKKQKAEEGEETDCFTRLFVMRGFPPLAHKKRAYKTIVERESYVVIFTQLLQEVKTSFEFNETQMGEEEAKRDSESSTNSEPGMDTNLIVTGNPGTGKSRFYLYCIFQLILREREDVKQLPPYELVVNFGNEFHKAIA